MTAQVTIEDIRAAAHRAGAHVRRTPLLNSAAIDRIAGRRVWIKAECLQFTGSFKARGGWAALSNLSQDARANGVIAYSSGNHAQGVARAAQFFGAPAVIVMPSDAPASKIEGTRALGAEIVLYDRETEDRDEIGNRIAQERNLSLIKPFDDPRVIAGQGTAGLEIAEQAAEAGVRSADVLVCCGGGGLSAGIALALEAMAPDMRVRPVEPVGFDDVARSLRSGRIESNPTTAGSICDAIVTRAPGELTFPILKRLCGPGIVVPDQDCQRAMVAAFQHLKLVIEPGGAIALAAALFHNGDLGPEVIVTASGGNVDRTAFVEALALSP